MNSFYLTITAIVVLVATVSSTVAQPWYTPCVAKGTGPFKCPGHLRTEKLEIPISPFCQGAGDEYACYDDTPDKDGGWRRGEVATACKYSRRRGGFCSQGLLRSCPRRFHRSVDTSSYCKDYMGSNLTRMICTA